MDAGSFRLEVGSSRLEAGDCKLVAGSCRLKLKAGGWRVEAADWRLEAAKAGVQAQQRKGRTSLGWPGFGCIRFILGTFRPHSGDVLVSFWDQPPAFDPHPPASCPQLHPPEFRAADPARSDRKF